MGIQNKSLTIQLEIGSLVVVANIASLSSSNLFNARLILDIMVLLADTLTKIGIGLPVGHILNGLFNR